MATKKPWAVLLCKFKNNSSEPPAAPGVLPFRTVCENFFTKTNAGFNLVRFFSDMSHESIDISDSKVLGWYTLNVNIIGRDQRGDPIFDKTQNEVVDLAKQAAIDSGVPLNTFVGVVVIMNVATGWAQGNLGWVAADWRRVDGRNFDGTLGPRVPGGGNGTEIFGQEMGHGFGLNHSRRDGSNADYQDKWDIMSTKNAYSAADQSYAARGPGLNAANMRSLGWLDKSRVWRVGSGGNGVIQLRPLHRHDLPGFLAAEFPPFGKDFVVEFRARDRWDAGVPRSAVLVHQFYGGHSYIMSGLSGSQDLVVGDTFESGSSPFLPTKRVDVLSIDENDQIATVRLSHVPAQHSLLDLLTYAVSGRVIGQLAADGGGVILIGGRPIPVPPWDPMAEVLDRIVEWRGAEDLSNPSLRAAVRRDALERIGDVVQFAIHDMDRARVPAPTPTEPLGAPCNDITEHEG